MTLLANDSPRHAHKRPPLPAARRESGVLKTRASVHNCVTISRKGVVSAGSAPVITPPLLVGHSGRYQILVRRVSDERFAVSDLQVLFAERDNVKQAQICLYQISTLVRPFFSFLSERLSCSNCSQSVRACRVGANGRDAAVRHGRWLLNAW